MLLGGCRIGGGDNAASLADDRVAINTIVPLVIHALTPPPSGMEFSYCDYARDKAAVSHEVKSAFQKQIKSSKQDPLIKLCPSMIVMQLF